MSFVFQWFACYVSFCVGLAVGVGIVVSLLTIASKVFAKDSKDA